MTVISRLVFFNQKKTAQKSSEPIQLSQISIVIPVKDNQKGIDQFLGNFFDKIAPSGYPREIIIVDNNSKEPLEINDHFLNSGLDVILLTCAKPGPGAARNAGVRKARGKWLLFNDSDCIPSETLLSGYLESDNLSLAYAGNVKALKKGLVSKYYESQEILLPMKVMEPNGNYFPQYLITANALVWKPAFDEVGGFNEKIQIAGGEDIDLGLRISQLGSISYAFKSIAYHNFSESLLEFIGRFVRYGKGNRMVAKLWNTSMSPRLFRPNKKTIINEILAKLQYLALYLGYLSRS